MVKSNNKRKRILLVEDQEDSWEIVAFALDEYTLFYARDFNEGLRRARRGYFDLYILDNHMPGGNGVELCRLIREFDPNTPILFYSATASARDMHAAFSAGAQTCLAKPGGFDELARTVARLTDVPPGTAIEARHAEVAAIREELAIRRMETAELLETAKQKLLRAEEKALRLKAQIAFLAAGGARGDFAREWPLVFTEEVRNPRHGR